MRQQTFQKALSRMTETGVRLFFAACLLFALLTAIYNIWLCLAELVLILLLYLFFQTGISRRKKEVMAYLDHMTSGVDVASRRTLISSPLPIAIFRPDTDDIIWSNERFLHLTGDPDHLFETKLSALVPSFQSQWLLDGDHLSPEPVPVGDQLYLVFGNLVCTGGQDEFLATTYWVDVTEYARVAEQFDATRPVVGILQVDNYEDLNRGLEEGERSVIRTEINNRLAAWVDPAHGMLCRYDRDHYILLVEAGQFQDFYRRKFSILDEIRQVQSPNGVAATLSIGFGRNGASPRELHEFASLALDMALSRGGDQVVVKNKFNFEFYGGRTKELEKRTKVKSRVMANALGELMADASRVFVMGHKYPDMDCIGAAAGVCAMARKKGAPVHIIKEAGQNPASEMSERLGGLGEYKDVFLSQQDAILLADANCLLVVVDTNRPEQVVSQDLLEAVHKVAVIDHHRRASSYIADAALNFHEPYASSASELVTELLQYLLEPADLLKTEAEALLAGMVLDTKQFTMRTGSRTFEAAAFLRRSGADTGDVKKLFQNDLEGTIAKYDIIQNAKMYHEGIAVAKVDHTVGRITAAQAADELLNISGIDTSFVLFPDQEGRVILSARSMGDVNVQVVLEKLGGGGNAATAGAQVPGKGVDEVNDMLLQAIDAYLEEE